MFPSMHEATASVRPRNSRRPENQTNPPERLLPQGFLSEPFNEIIHSTNESSFMNYTRPIAAHSTNNANLFQSLPSPAGSFPSPCNSDPESDTSSSSASRLQESFNFPLIQNQHLFNASSVATYEIGDISKEYLEKLAIAYVMNETGKGHEVTSETIAAFLVNFQKMYPETLNQYLNKCQFCLRNGNNIHAIDHSLKDKEGNVICPVLYSYVCSICKATGPKAHTWKYCPFNPYTNGDPVTAGMKPGRFQGRT